LSFRSAWGGQDEGS